jgi:YggT family protein
MLAVLDIIRIVIQLLMLVLVVQAILSWLLVFNVVNGRNQVVKAIWQFTHALTEPMLKPIRSVIKPINGLDLAPLILILLLILVDRLLIYYVYPQFLLG